MAKVGDNVQYNYDGTPVAALVTVVNADETVNLMLFGTDWTDSRFNVVLGTEHGNWQEIQ